MAKYPYRNELIDNYVREFQSRIVSETGIESDKYHLGKIILRSHKDDPDFVMQIDGGTGESETNGSMLKRSIQCANSFKNMGLKTGDTMVLMAPNHLDLAVPFYAALYQGIATAAIDRTLLVNELKDTFDIIKPKVIFCQSEKVQDVRKALELLGLESKIISFDKSPDTISLSEMLAKHGDENDVENFKPADFDPDETIAYLISTSGTTGLPKSTILTHKNMMTTAPASWYLSKQELITKIVLLIVDITVPHDENFVKLRRISNSSIMNGSRDCEWFYCEEPRKTSKQSLVRQLDQRPDSESNSSGHGTHC